MEISQNFRPLTSLSGFKKCVGQQNRGWRKKRRGIESMGVAALREKIRCQSYVGSDYVKAFKRHQSAEV